MRSAFLFACILALAACGKDSSQTAANNPERVLPSANASTGQSQPATAPKGHGNGNSMSGMLALWSGNASAAAGETPAAAPTVAAAPALTPEQRMAEDIRRFREGQRRRQMAAEAASAAAGPNDRTGDKAGPRQGDLVGRSPSDISAAKTGPAAAMPAAPVMTPELELARQQRAERMAEDIRRFRQGQAMRLAQQNKPAYELAASAAPASQAGPRAGDRSGMRAGDRALSE